MTVGCRCGRMGSRAWSASARATRRPVHDHLWKRSMGQDVDPSAADAERPSARVGPLTLEPFLRGRASVKTGSPAGPRLILRRSIVARAIAGIIAIPAAAQQVLSAPWLIGQLLGRGAPGVGFFFIVFVNLPVLLWSMNVLRCRTVMSACGIDMRRLLRTERRPWPATRSGFAVSGVRADVRDSDGFHSFYIQRCRLILVNGLLDDVRRMPGCVFGGTLRIFGENCETRARFALERIWAFAVAQGWIVSDPALVAVDPALAQACSDQGSQDVRTARSAVDDEPLVYDAPAWGRLLESVLDGGATLICTGAVFVAVAGLMLSQPARNNANTAVGLLGLVLGAAAVVFPLVKMSMCFRKTVVDRGAIRAGGKKYGWPDSRSSLYVAGDRVVMVDREGIPVPLLGTGGASGGFARREKTAAAQCEEIWSWGVAVGATGETGHYIPLRNGEQQREREVFERRAGLVFDR